MNAETGTQHLKRRMAGYQAKRMGEQFERTFAAASCAVAITRMPDGCKTVGPKRLVRVPTAFDWILTWRGRTAFVDTKTTHEKLFPAQKIKEHQLTELLKHHNQGALSGYVVQYTEHDKVVFIPAPLLLRCYQTRKGLPADEYGTTQLGTMRSFYPELIFNPREPSAHAP